MSCHESPLTTRNPRLTLHRPRRDKAESNSPATERKQRVRTFCGVHRGRGRATRSSQWEGPRIKPSVAAPRPHLLRDTKLTERCQGRPSLRITVCTERHDLEVPVPPSRPYHTPSTNPPCDTDSPLRSRGPWRGQSEAEGGRHFKERPPGPARPRRGSTLRNTSTRHRGQVRRGVRGVLRVPVPASPAGRGRRGPYGSSSCLDAARLCQARGRGGDSYRSSGPRLARPRPAAPFAPRWARPSPQPPLLAPALQALLSPSPLTPGPARGSPRPRAARRASSHRLPQASSSTA